MNSMCYRKVHRRLTWYEASNKCLVHGGSLAVFADIGRPLQSKQLIDWLDTSDKNSTYWIGLIRSWWQGDVLSCSCTVISQPKNRNRRNPRNPQNLRNPTAEISKSTYQTRNPLPKNRNTRSPRNPLSYNVG